MSLFTVTFDSSESCEDGAGEPRRKAGGVRRPDKPKFKRISRKRAKEENQPTRIQKEKVGPHTDTPLDEERQNHRRTRKTEKQNVDFSPKMLPEDIKELQREEEDNEEEAIHSHGSSIKRKQAVVDEKQKNTNDQEKQGEDDYEEDRTMSSKDEARVGCAPYPRIQNTVLILPEASEAGGEEDINDDDDEMIIQFRKTLPKPTQTMLKYQFDYHTFYSWHGKMIHFQLSLNGEPLLHAKSKKKTGVDEIPISSGKECHFTSPEHEGVILVGNDNLSFSLRKSTKYGNEQCNVKFVIPGGMKPRQCSLHLFGEKLKTPPDLYTRSFINKGNGVYLVRLSHRTAKPSIKNCILVDGDDMEWMIILKVAPGVLSIEAAPSIDPMVAFSVGIASYLCKS